MADQPKNPERYWKRERIFKQHPAVAAEPRLSDALKDTDKEGNVNIAAKERLEAEASKGPDDETHYGRIRRLNREWNEDHPIHREHKVEFTPWEQKPYNERALHHVQFGIPNGGGAMSTHPQDELQVRLHSYRNDDGTTDHYSKLEQVPAGWSDVEGLVKGVGHALGEKPELTQAKLDQQLRQEPGDYPKEFGGGHIEKRRAVAKEFGMSAYKQSHYDDPDPFSHTRRN